MDVRIYQPRNHVGPGEIGYRHPRGRCVSDGHHAIAGDQDEGVRFDVSGAHVDELAGKHGLGGGWGLGVRAGAEEREGEGRKEQQTACHVVLEANIQAREPQTRFASQLCV